MHCPWVPLNLLIDNTLWMFADEVIDAHDFEESHPLNEQIVQAVANYFHIPVIHLINDNNLESSDFFTLLVRLLSDCNSCDVEAIATFLHRDIKSIQSTLERSVELLQSNSILASQFVYLYLSMRYSRITV